MANIQQIAPNCHVDVDQMKDITKSEFKAKYTGKFDVDKAWKLLEIHRKADKKKSSSKEK